MEAEERPAAAILGPPDAETSTVLVRARSPLVPKNEEKRRAATLLAVNPRGTKQRPQQRQGLQLAKCSKRAPSKQVQLCLDLGQKSFLPTRCATCGMLYSRGDPKDEQHHAEHHQNHSTGFRFQGWSQERVIQDNGALGRILLVLKTDSAVHIKKVLEISSHLEQCLGLAAGWLLPSFLRPSAAHTTELVFMHVTPCKRIDGICIMERLTAAVSCTRVEGQEQQEPSAAAAAGGAAAGPRGSAPAAPERPIVGARAIWVSKDARRKKLATRLLDAARLHTVPCFVVPRERIAFAQPSSEGMAFALSYAGLGTFVYEG